MVRKKIQKKSDKICGDTDLIFTANIWQPTNGNNKQTKKISPTVSIKHSKFFLYLDAEIFWNDGLKFKVYNKPNQQIKYITNRSCHTHHCLKAIPLGVLNRLTKITSITSKNKDTKLDVMYPKHAEALIKARLVTKDFPTL